MEFTDLEKYRELRKQFEDQTGDHWTNSQGEPDIDYVSWLEQKLVKESDSLPCVRLSLHDAKLLSKIIKWYRKQIVNHGLPDRKKYREFCKQKEIELLGNEA